MKPFELFEKKVKRLKEANKTGANLAPIDYETIAIWEQLRQAQAELEDKNKITYCVYCGAEFLIDADGTPSAVEEHIKICPDHPLFHALKHIAQLEAELEANKKYIIEVCKEKDAQDEQLQQAQAERDALDECLQEITQWCNAYPLTVFPEPDLKKAHELLKAGGITLDAVSASAMRHGLEGVAKIIEATRKEIND
jgi:hypothetical protein